MDRFSRWPDAKFTSSPTAKTTIDFLRSYFSQHGHPKKIRVDSGTNFTSKLFQDFCKENNWEMLFDKNTPGLLYVASAIDVTEEILKLIDTVYEESKS